MHQNMHLLLLFLLFRSMRDETREIQQEKEENKGDLRQFCMWMNYFAHKIKKLITYSRDNDFGFCN